MSVTTSLWWPEDRIKATLSSEYVFGHLPSNILHRLVEPLPWGEGLTSETYLDWILSKAGRLFLILVDIGIPDRIFALVDESFDDSDLPIAAHSVDRLHLSPENEDPSLESKFFLAQWRFIVRGIGEGEYVKYTENEGVPVELLRTGTALVREGVERVVLASAVCRVYLRTQVTIGGAPHFFEEDEVLEEIKSLRRLAHDHVYSIYGSYFVDKTVCILFTGVYERTLMSFLTDIPSHFKRLPKAQRREILLNWPHCLANGFHGSMRMVRVFLGQFEALDTLLPPVKVDDVESYQYGAPERWVRLASVQQAGPQRVDLPSGGRTARKQSAHPMKLNLSILKGPHRAEHESVSPRSGSMASQSTAIRVGLPGSRFSFAASSSSGSSNGSARKRVISSIKRPILYTPSITSSSSSGSSSNRASSVTNPVGLPGTNSSVAVVHTWESHQTDPEASDIFSLGAVILDIFTHLCKRKISAFAHHRGAKNRTAGRGGGVADCSFHLDRNLNQVTSWITLLDHDSKKQKDPVFQAVRPMLAVVRNMLNKEPADRPSAYQVEHHFSVIMHQLGRVANMHCSSRLQCHTGNPKGRLHEGPHATTPRLTVPSISRSASPHSPLSVATNSPIYSEGSTGFTPSPSPSVAGFNLSGPTVAYSENSDTDQESRRYTDSDAAPWYDPSWNYRMAI
ncbi:protein kinase domain-containing protein [Aspergillus nomiae NRRL 13137]|uniref:Protein kinase domain-containing protein n=1 Tax=Aspergillus nomiae NRRL (strain ATCC 15546 / NRRL 13137 / CBS 260.88 / M93) TaxID=1509407 RepID=A0A0L1J1Z5_ASPN3|nr:protein kinase domain-containing protein [Aspergillus nomiae NRRL 13137]KNG85690.1 protein kinase domain-containing protein [Aspergillus nomiae NRRL 13137]